MNRHKKHWTQTMFIDKGGLWLHYMNEGWKQAPAAVNSILRILKKSGITKGRALELGCGNGRITLNLAKRGFDACGVDMSQLYIDDGIRRARKMRIRADLRPGDYRKVDRMFSGRFDVVISIWTSIGFYGKRSDELLFKKVAKLLRKNGLFLILNTMSKERLLSFFNPHMFEEDAKYLKLSYNLWDKKKSVTKNKWIFFKKMKRNLKYVDEIEFDLRIYSLPEVIAMAKKNGLILIKAYDLLSTLKPARQNSPINMVFQKE